MNVDFLKAVQGGVRRGGRRLAGVLSDYAHSETAIARTMR